MLYESTYYPTQVSTSPSKQTDITITFPFSPRNIMRGSVGQQTPGNAVQARLKNIETIMPPLSDPDHRLLAWAKLEIAQVGKARAEMSAGKSLV